jgi:hypothetical protein
MSKPINHNINFGPSHDETQWAKRDRSKVRVACAIIQAMRVDVGLERRFLVEARRVIGELRDGVGR